MARPHVSPTVPLLSGAAAGIYIALKDDLVTGRIHPGAVLHETEIAERFEVSKSPVRDALSLLRAEGYVQAIPRRGYVASEVSLREFTEVFHVRAILEGEAAALAAEHASSAQVKRLEDLLRQARAAGAVPEPGMYVQVNHDLHMTVAEASGNLLLQRIMEQLLDRAERAIALGVGIRHRTPRAAEYRETAALIRAIRARQPDAARRAMEAHITGTRRRLLALEVKAKA